MKERRRTKLGEDKPRQHKSAYEDEEDGACEQSSGFDSEEGKEARG